MASPPPDGRRPGSAPEVYRNRRRLVVVSLVTLALLGFSAFRGFGGNGNGTHRPNAGASTSPSAGPAAGGRTGVRHFPGLKGWHSAAGLVGHLAPGSDPRALPGPVLIVDKLNDRLLIVDQWGRIRWQFPAPGDLAPGQTFRIPDDAFFTPDGRYIVATQEDDFVITLIDVTTGHIVWRYGVPAVPGAGPNRLDNPDDAMVLPNGDVLSADIKNCRLVLIPPRGHAILRQFGTTGYCLHHPPASYGSPNGAFPTVDGHVLVTEINGSWVDEITSAGRLLWSVHLPGVAYPSDSNQIGPDRYLTVDWSSPGQVVIFDRAGHILWRYARGLNHPSLALPLPNGDILLNDDFDHRVIVIDPHTDRVVWQYGHDGVAGQAPGYLDNPDGVDLLPPYSFLIRTFG